MVKPCLLEAWKKNNSEKAKYDAALSGIRVNLTEQSLHLLLIIESFPFIIGTKFCYSLDSLLSPFIGIIYFIQDAYYTQDT